MAVSRAGVEDGSGVRVREAVGVGEGEGEAVAVGEGEEVAVGVPVGKGVTDGETVCVEDGRGVREAGGPAAPASSLQARTASSNGKIIHKRRFNSIWVSMNDYSRRANCEERWVSGCFPRWIPYIDPIPFLGPVE